MLALSAPAGCQLWLLDLRQAVDAEHWLACSPAEHARAARFRFERDAARYRAAHALLRRVLAQALGGSPAQLAWRTGEHGKPHLLGHEGWHFNLSHSGDWALLGLSEGQLIGVDIECHKPMPDLNTLVRHHFSDEEQASFLALPEAVRETFFLRTWASKEACLKAIGSGLTLEPRCFTAPWAEAWTPAQVPVGERLVSLQVHGLALPMEADGVAAAVALMPPHALTADW